MKVLDILKEAQGKVVVVGDTIAQGIGSSIPNAVVVAGAGLDSASIASKVMADPNLKGADLAVVSAGTYDVKPGNLSIVDPDATGANLRAIKKALGAKKIVWIRPYNAGASLAVSKIANIDGDKTIDLKMYPSADKIVPGNYADLASASTFGITAINKPASLDASPEVVNKIDKDKKDTAQPAPGGGAKKPVNSHPFDPEIQKLQKELESLGYVFPTYGSDGYYGDETKSVISQFQQDNKLQVTGHPSKETMELLSTAVKDPAKYKKPAGSVPPGQGSKPPSGNVKVASPVKGAMEVMSRVGMRGGRLHQGVDIKAKTPTPLYSPINGTVTKAGDGWAGNGGSGVKIDGDGQTHKFFHLSNVSVKEGQAIKQGDQFGISGGVKGAPGSGNSTGPHIHWEMWIKGKPVDPTQYVGQ